MTHLPPLWRKPDRVASSILIGLTLLIPVTIVAERVLPETWGQRLAITRFEPRYDRHTPRVVAGTALPSHIAADLRLDDISQTYVLTEPVTIAPGATLTLAAGVHVVANEFAHLSVEGTLVAEGTKEKPVTLTTNEQHPENQTWGGVLFQPGSVGDITQARLRHAAPGVSCLPDSTVVVHESEISHTSTGIYTASDRCLITTSTIRSVDTGVVARGVEARLRDTTIFAGGKDSVQF